MLTININDKKYSSKVILQNIELQIPKNGLYGFVGKNGSGKTTLFKCVSHLTDFQGEILYKNKKLLPQQIAFLTTEPFLYEHLTVGEFYNFFRKLAQINHSQEPIFDVNKNLLIKELSTGMRKKVYFNAVFQKKYDIYIFDEPFNGLDLESVFSIKKLLTTLSENHIVFISSHILETLKDCHKIFLLENNSLTVFENYQLDKLTSFLTRDFI
ncbi:ATP-binding cassette domain-containing protein [Capnocytophaga felis]|uniref:ABC transporter ATP-binding protein n=1 Tax=Capnocytophaga felis TaxID=2267611 RepID=A0A5M4BA43_9FLAO|nr:ATP-binding cassette domain-containing protein [Capnocytophaga felis]GET46115.1 ABC transporter ATP-binding protein [Capnocytophaga felis]GET48907.1 ABC transporter ATP-binding protein [Capnocytophaga felis]